FNPALYPPCPLAVFLDRKNETLSRTPTTAPTATAPVALTISPTRPVPSVLVRRPAVGRSNAAVSGSKKRRSVCGISRKSTPQKTSVHITDREMGRGKVTSWCLSLSMPPLPTEPVHRCLEPLFE